jgi:hypothetical protein
LRVDDDDAPVLENLRREFQEGLEKRKIEPNSGLGAGVG